MKDKNKQAQQLSRLRWDNPEAHKQQSEAQKKSWTAKRKREHAKRMRLFWLTLRKNKNKKLSTV